MKIKMLDGLSGEKISLTAGDEVTIGKSSGVSKSDALRLIGRGVAESADAEMEKAVDADIKAKQKEAAEKEAAEKEA